MGSDSADVIKDYVAAQRQQASLLASAAVDMQDMLFITHSQTVLFCSLRWLPPLLRCISFFVLPRTACQAWCVCRCESM